MTPEEINIAIAKTQGITQVYNVIGRGLVYAVHTESGMRERQVPNYYGSLDAMHDAEMHMRNNMGLHFLKDYYENQLPRVVMGSVGCWNIVSATAGQRAEAFLRTLGEWRD